MKTLNERMIQAAIGKIGDNTIKSVGQAYLNYMIKHPGIYETIQWATWQGCVKSMANAKRNIYDDL